MVKLHDIRFGAITRLADEADAEHLVGGSAVVRRWASVERRRWKGRRGVLWQINKRQAGPGQGASV